MSDQVKIANKATRLAVAGLVAPILRGQSERTSKRRVARIDKDGNVVGYTTLADVQKALLERQRIELEVVDGARPTETMCKHCGKVIEVKRVGPIPETCQDGCNRSCDTPDCEGQVSITVALRRVRNGGSGFCRKCAARRGGVAMQAAMSEEEKASRVSALKRAGADPSERKRRAEAMRMARKDPLFNAKLQESIRANYSDPAFREKKVKEFLRMTTDPAVRKRNEESMRKRTRTKEWREKNAEILRAARQKKAEKKAEPR